MRRREREKKREKKLWRDAATCCRPLRPATSAVSALGIGEKRALDSRRQ